MDQNFARRKWRLLRNTVHLLYAAKQGTQVRHVSDIGLLLKEVEELEVGPAYTTQTRLRTALGAYRASERLFELVSRGARDDLDAIVALVHSDPKRYTRETGDPESLVNRRNLAGHTPLYEAALNGHLPVLRLLLELNANPELTSLTDGEDMSRVQEYPLQVAARWGHLHIVEHLLSTCSLSTRQVQLAFKSAREGPVRNLLRDRVSITRRLLCCK